MRNTNFLRPLGFLAIVVHAFSCGDQKNVQNESGKSETSISTKYATGFQVSALGNARLVEVTYPFQGATSGYTYLLVPKGQRPPEHPDARVIYTPVERIVCTSTTHIPLLDYLGETNKLVGFPTTDYITSRRMRQRIDSGAVTELGIDQGLNLERLAVLQPDLVMGYILSGDYGQFRKIESLGIPVVINGEYLERHPLGRAEWIKFMALFFGKEQEADSVFAAIERSYLHTLSLLKAQRTQPTVLSGIVYGDTWFLPGGQNYAARLLKDAGCHYLWEDSENNGYLELSFESVYEKAHNADLWIGTGTYKTLAELRAADQRYAKFEAFKSRSVFNYDARTGEKGGKRVFGAWLPAARPDSKRPG